MFLRTNKAENAALSGNVSGAKKGVPSVISNDLHILGNLISEGHIDVDGSVEGNIKAEQVTIRPHGKVTGDVVAANVHVYGEVRGLIRAHSVHLYSSCHVEGVIIHQSLSVEDGAFIDGKFKRMQDKSLLSQSSEDLESPATVDTDGLIEETPSSLPGNLRLIG